MAIQLRKHGYENFTIFEKADDIGGVWRDNTYPDAGCDVPSHLYSFSFERRTDWTRRFPKQPEILAYANDCVDKHHLRDRIRTGTEIAGATWDANDATWTLTTTDGTTHTFDAVVWGLGQLNRPKWPHIDGLDSFGGTIFHSARWNHDHDLDGDRIAVIGNGASAVQFVPPVAEIAARLFQFQHSPNWFLPKPDAPFTAEEIRRFRRIPGWDLLYRSRLYASFESKWFALRAGSKISQTARELSTRHITKHVPDPELRAKLIPDFPVGCKRILISDNYLQALCRDNVEVVDDPITRIEPDAVITADGTRRRVDTIIVATGFDTTNFLAPVDITGVDGRKLQDDWAEGARAYQGIAVPGFPNSFILYGPNTNLNHNSIIFMLEAQFRWVLASLDVLRRGARSVAVRRDAARRYDARMQRELQHTTFAADCHSWYKNEAGRIVNNWPGPTLRYWFDTHRLR
ncbi:MAG: NAD(P)/FAD-dependent oxidoreductase, partial [Actinobacteria bacterium]|nr:NAD(P)/FAD-dependent oxidoreductase [Actinomycetota bacterium]